MKRSFAFSMALLPAALGLSCTSEETFQFHLVKMKIPETATAYCTKGQDTAEALEEKKYTLRVTFLYRKSKVVLYEAKMHRQYEILCDRIIKPGSPVNLQLVVPTDTPLGLRVDVFDPADKNKLVYSGQTERLELGGEEATVLLRPSGKLSCVEKAKKARAFHTATLLPNGQVLLMGGVISDATVGSNKLHVDTQKAFVTGSVEVYDPATREFSEVTGSISGRAFHQAHLLPGLPSPLVEDEKLCYEILVIGGIQTGKTSPEAIRLRAGSTSYPFLISPYETAQAGEAALVKFYPATAKSSARLTYTSLPQLPKAFYPSSVLLPDTNQVLVVGGASVYTSTGNSPGFSPVSSIYLLNISSSGQNAQITMGSTDLPQRTRVGHALTPLGKNRWLSLGGTMGWSCTGSSDPKCDTDVAESVERTSSGIKTGLYTFTTPPATTAWHTLTPLGVTDKQMASGYLAPSSALWAGGFPLYFETKTMRIDDQGPDTAKPLRLVTDGIPPVITTVSLGGGANDFQAVGYHAALRLPDGSVLLSGGNVNSQLVTDSPCKTTHSLFCAYSQIVAYGLVNGKVQYLSRADMHTKRFGHCMTRLLDNTVLITGGITLTAAKEAFLVEYAELYSPRTGAAAEDPFDRGPAQDYDTANKVGAGKSQRCEDMVPE